ncbi:MAG: hypothetical protein ACRC10_06265 [Thermoguttaceae bacterium]
MSNTEPDVLQQLEFCKRSLATEQAEQESYFDRELKKLISEVEELVQHREQYMSLLHIQTQNKAA